MQGNVGDMEIDDESEEDFDDVETTDKKKTE